MLNTYQSTRMMNHDPVWPDIVLSKSINNLAACVWTESDTMLSVVNWVKMSLAAPEPSSLKKRSFFLYMVDSLIRRDTFSAWFVVGL